jgi:hypothetical protein
MMIYDKKKYVWISLRTLVAGFVVGGVTKSDTRGSSVKLLRQLPDEGCGMSLSTK